MWRLQVTLVAMVNFILYIKWLWLAKAITFLLILYDYCTMFDGWNVFLFMLASVLCEPWLRLFSFRKEPFHPSLLLCLSPSPLYCSGSFHVYIYTAVLENFSNWTCAQTLLWWQSFEKVFVSDDGGFVLQFAPFVALNSLIACSFSVGLQW